MTEQVIRGRWVFPVAGPPLADGTVTVRGSTIVSVDPAGSRTADVDLGNIAVIPGLVNAHTHLDLSILRGAVPPTPDFVDWLRAVIAWRRSTTPDETDAAIAAGLAESMRFGTTLVGDIAFGGTSWPCLAAAPIRAVCFREFLGLPGERVNAVWDEAGRWMADHADTPTCRAALSPHAPYSVHKTLIEAAARIAPVAIHVAESAAECEMIESHSGAMVPFLQDLGVWDVRGPAPSFEWIAWKAARAPFAVFAHGNLLSPTMRLPPTVSLAYCPRTHAGFGHPPYPLAEFLAHGTRVAFGTDSLASNPDLDVLAEARYAAERHPDVPLDRILAMTTLDGAAALGFDAVTGSLEPGKSADLVTVPLPDHDGDPHRLLLHDADFTLRRRTMWCGEWRS